MRTKPYTTQGIKRIPCSRCKKPSVHQWQICADGNVYRGLCTDCDVALNRLVLEFIHDPDIEAKLEKYRNSL